MDCSTSLTHLPILPQLPRGLVFLLVVSLTLQLVLLVPALSQPILPALTLIPGRTHLRAAHLRRGRHMVSVPRWGRLLTNVLPRLCVRSSLLALLVQTSGWHALTPWSELVLLLPGLQVVLTLTWRTHTVPHRMPLARWNVRLQRLYQLILLLLTVSTLVHFLGGVPHVSPESFLSMALGVSATSTDDDTEIYIEPLTENQFPSFCAARSTFSGNPRMVLKKCYSCFSCGAYSSVEKPDRFSPKPRSRRPSGCPP